MYISVEELRQYLNIIEPVEDSLLESIIKQAQAYFESKTDRRFEFIDTQDPTEFKYTVGVHTFGDVLVFDRDFVQVDKVTVKADGDNPIVIPETAYILIPTNFKPYYEIAIIDSDYSWAYEKTPINAIVISGKGVYSLKPPEDVRRAIFRIAGFYYEQRGAQVFEQSAVEELEITKVSFPNDVMDIIKRYERIV